MDLSQDRLRDGGGDEDEEGKEGEKEGKEGDDDCVF
jgi:hypothetical protein